MHDDWYEELMNAHKGLSEAQSRRFDAALVLLLANLVNDPHLLRRCLADARAAVQARETP